MAEYSSSEDIFNSKVKTPQVIPQTKKLKLKY